MRVMDIFCSSPASTAVRSSAAARRLSDSPRSQNPSDNNNDNKKLLTVPCLSSEMPLIPLPLQKSRRSSVDVDFRRKNSAGDVEVRRKSSADVSDLRKRASSGSSSSRYLLRDQKEFIDDECLSSSDLVPLRHQPVSSSSPPPPPQPQPQPSPAPPSSSSSSSSASAKDSSSDRSTDQVVVLRVSIHCKGCEGKVRKHISKMEGVTSYSIDLATKKVTVVGKVKPLEVLHSISRIKYAYFWDPSDSSLHHHHSLNKN